mmetsp:Transcript_7954/g.11505  ORF Transcript_7954/g.11505 Transcript_7954/m.11505 type:complete len:85 (-) Transcript_7954:486-740(-)
MLLLEGSTAPRLTPEIEVININASTPVTGLKEYFTKSDPVKAYKKFPSSVKNMSSKLEITFEEYCVKDTARSSVTAIIVLLLDW